MLPPLTKLAGALAVRNLQRGALRRLGSQVLQWQARYQAAAQAIVAAGAKGAAGRLASGAAVQVGAWVRVGAARAGGWGGHLWHLCRARMLPMQHGVAWQRHRPCSQLVCSAALPPQAAQQGLTAAAARYAAVRGALALLGPLMWASLAVDLVNVSLGTDYARVVKAVFALAQIRLLRTRGFCNAEE